MRHTQIVNTQSLRRPAKKQQEQQPRTVQEVLVYAGGQSSYIGFLLNHAIDSCTSNLSSGKILDDVEVALANVKSLYSVLSDVADSIEQSYNTR